MRTVAVCLILFIASTAYASNKVEVILNFDEESLPIINNNFRALRARMHRIDRVERHTEIIRLMDGTIADHDGDTYVRVETTSTNAANEVIYHNDNVIRLVTAGVEQVNFEDGVMYSVTDEHVDIGRSGNRFGEVYATGPVRVGDDLDEVTLTYDDVEERLVIDRDGEIKKSIPEFRLTNIGEFSYEIVFTSLEHWELIGGISGTGQYVYGGTTSKHAARSDDYGETLSQIGGLGHYSEHHASAVSEAGQYVVLATKHVGSTSKILLVSSDYGQTFAEKLAGTFDTHRQALGISMSRSGQYIVVYLSFNNSRYYLSDDYGATWTSRSNRPFPYDTPFMSISDCGGTVYYYADDERNIYYTDDWGLSWNYVGKGPLYTHRMQWSRDNQKMIANDWDIGKVHVSNNYGNTFSEVIDIEVAPSVSCDYSGDTFVVGSTRFPEHYLITFDFGESFIEVPTPVSSDVWVRRLSGDGRFLLLLDAVTNTLYGVDLTGKPGELLAGGARREAQKLVLFDDNLIEFVLGGTSQLRLDSGVLYPTTDNVVDLGSPTHEWKNLYVDGLAYIDGFGEDTDMGNFNIHSIGTLYGVDDYVYIDMSNDGYVDIGADVGVRIHSNTTWDTGSDITVGTTQWNRTNDSIDAAVVEIEKVGTATHTSIEDFINNTMSSGFVTGGVITDNYDGTVNVAAGTGYIRVDSSSVSTLKAFEWDASNNLSLTNDAMNYVYVDYNAGNPVVAFTTTPAGLDHTSEFVIGLVYQRATRAYISTSGQRLNDFIHDLYHYSWEYSGIQRSSGVVTSEDATEDLALNITAGVVYWALERHETAAFDSSTIGSNHVFSYVYRDGLGGWTTVADQHVINNANYDDGTGALGTLTSNRYGVHWVYMTIDGSVYVQYGQGDYTLAQAEAASIPDTTSELQAVGIFAAKIIVQKSATDFYEVYLPWTSPLGAAPATLHNGLAGLQGGAAGEYYHLTSAEYTGLTGWLTGYPADAAGALINDGLGALSWAKPWEHEGYLTSESDPVVGAISGLVKADGVGNIAAAIAGTDYLATGGWYDAAQNTIALSGFDDDLSYLTSVAFSDLTDYPADAAGVLTNDGAGALSWVAGGSGEAMVKSISQAGHGLSVGDVVKFSAGAFSKAQADSAANAEVIGIVETATDVDNFDLLYGGYIDTLSGLSANTVYFLSEVTAGLLTATPPTGEGDIVKPLLVSTSATEGYFYNWRGNEVAASYPTKIQDADADTYITTEPTPDADEIVAVVGDTEAMRIHSNGIIDMPKQSSAKAYLPTAVQSINTGTWTKVALSAEEYDIQGEFDTTTNYRFTATEEGYYQVNARALFQGASDGQVSDISIYRNGGAQCYAAQISGAAADQSVVISDIIYLEAGDYLELYVWQNSGVSKNIYFGYQYTCMSVHKIM